MTKDDMLDFMTQATPQERMEVIRDLHLIMLPETGPWDKDVINWLPVIKWLLRDITGMQRVVRIVQHEAMPQGAALVYSYNWEVFYPADQVNPVATGSEVSWSSAKTNALAVAIKVGWLVVETPTGKKL